jgi:hypothetical protein
MAIVSARVRSREQAPSQTEPKTRRRSGTHTGAVGPSIREVCLVGLGSSVRAGGVLDRAMAGGGPVTWWGRAYRIEATQVQTAATDGPMPIRYIHLAPLSGD